ncbi:MAG: DNA (cytosine-5-)-methyltransferase [Crocinitomicaceae bacterium]|nr:DNA (cytosine-5-)-methyltransferase [Crocinitomicaceae bacterium]
MNVLSLFDGISVGCQALKQTNLPIENYYASEIDEYAMAISRLNHPEIFQLGDIQELDTSSLPKIELLIAGSPCQDLSSLGKGAGLHGARSGLFFDALRILEQTKPKYFIFENVASMRDTDKKVITELLGVQPIMINSNLVSAQTRKRLYWTNIPRVELPTDKGILLQDILTEGFGDRDKAHTVLTNQLPETQGGLNRYLYKSTGQIAFREKYFTGLDKKTKLARFSNLLLLERNQPTPLYRNGVFRHLSVNECEALQTLPKDYTAGISNSQRFKCLGNSFTCSVIQHILSFIPVDN